MTKAEKEELKAFAASLVDSEMEERVALRLATLERRVALIERDRMLAQLTEEAA